MGTHPWKTTLPQEEELMARRDVIRKARDLVIQEGLDPIPLSHLTDLIEHQIKELHILGQAQLSVSNHQISTLMSEVKGVERFRKKQGSSYISYIKVNKEVKE